MPEPRSVLVLLASTLIAIGVAELVLRIFTPFPVTRFSNRVTDERLGYRLDPALPDVNSAGFRDSEASPPYDIVAIGDSHTYGVNVVSNESWPQQLAELTGLRADNLGVGSYNVFQYAELIELGLELEPRFVVVGLFAANDFEFGVCRLMRSPRWQRWVEDRELLDPGCGPQPEVDAFIPAPPTWTSELLSTPLGSAVQLLIWQPYVRSLFEPAVEIRAGGTTHFIELARVRVNGRGADLSRQAVSTGIENGRRLLQQMRDSVVARGSRFGLLLIPSKSRVLHAWAIAEGASPPAELAAAAGAEDEVAERLAVHLREDGIAFVDAIEQLVDLQRQSPGGVYPSADGHPRAAGYRAYAEAAAALLELLARPPD